MGRPTLRKKGPMTAAERQQRRRKRLRREKGKLAKDAEIAASRAKNLERLRQSQEQQAAFQEAWRREFKLVPPAPPLATPEDELAQQVLDTLQVERMDFEVFQQALLRRAGRTVCE
jgi:hypothetical protein